MLPTGVWEDIQAQCGGHCDLGSAYSELLANPKMVKQVECTELRGADSKQNS